QVDQFGNSEVNEYITGRTISAKVPMAETTVVNMNAIMPGSTLAQTIGAKAAGSFSFVTNPSVGDTITIDGMVIKFIANGATPVGNEVALGTTGSGTATAVAAFIAASTDPRLALATFVAATTSLNVTYGVDGTASNSYILSKPGTATVVTLMTGGVNDKNRADVSSGVGISLLAI